MSGKAVGWAMEQRTGSPTTKLVLLKLADNANEWVAWPSVQYIVDDTELSERAVREHLRKLETLGLVRAEKRFVDGVQTTTKYHLLADGWVPRKAGERIPRKKDKGASGAPVGHKAPKLHKMQGDGAESAPRVGHDAPPNPYREPLLEPSLSASENSPSVKPKEEPSSAWPEIWTAFQGWPGSEKQDWSERKAKTAWEALAPRPPDTDLILCIRAKGRDYAEENLRRKARGADAKWPTNPARWLGERLFDRLLDEARKSVTATLAAEAARPMALSEPIRERLITAGVATGEIKSYFAGCVHRHGPPEEFIFETDFAANLCENRCGARLRRENAFGEDLIIAVAKKVNAA